MPPKSLGRTVLRAAALLVLCVACGTQSESTSVASSPTPLSNPIPDPTPDAIPDPIPDPIPESIEAGDLVVAAVEFLQLPKTADAHERPTTLAGIDTPLPSSSAHARVQHMFPLRDGSGRLAISDLRGVLYVTDANGEQLTTFLDLRESTDDFGDDVFPNEAGLLGFAFHPDFGKVGAPGYGKLYTGYSAKSAAGTVAYLGDDAASHHSVLREWTAEVPSANVFAGPSRELLRVGQFAQNHNIGTLAFNHAASPGSPDYGKLYFSLGDGGSAYDPKNYGQGLSEPLGAILRIDPLGRDGGRQYAIPPDNPFIGQADVAPEIWAYGLRHAQQFSFDDDGRIFINDIGQNHVEEVNVGVAGANYGWRVREGTFATGYGVGLGISGSLYPNVPTDNVFVDPVAQYDHDEGNAIGSGFVYRGSSINALRGKYVFGDLVNGRLFYMDSTNLEPGSQAEIKELRVRIDGAERALLEVLGYPNTYAPGKMRVDLRLGIDAAGELYLLTKGDGRIRKLVSI